MTSPYKPEGWPTAEDLALMRADEIEVTPEMIEAGIETHDLMDAYDFSCDPSGWIRLIYRNMEKMRLKGIRCEDRKYLLL
jgi:hypothetical protein